MKIALPTQLSNKTLFLKYHKKSNFLKYVLHKESTVPKDLVFLLLLQHFCQKFNNLTLQYQHPCKNRKVYEKNMLFFFKTVLVLSECKSTQYHTFF